MTHANSTIADPITAYGEEGSELLAGCHESAQWIGDLVELFDESPNPFIRCDDSGHIIYANRASDIMGSGRGKTEDLPEFLLQQSLRSIKTKSSQVCEVKYDFQTYQFVLVPFQNYTYVNIHGRLLTGERQSEIEHLKTALTNAEIENRHLSELLLQAGNRDIRQELSQGEINNMDCSIKAINGYVDLCTQTTERTDARYYFLQKIKSLLENAAETIRYLFLYNNRKHAIFKDLQDHGGTNKELPRIEKNGSV